ncbi:MAG: hypothetical protein IPG50_02105 [Myxococcales bacterium]|nr:hypothetical protein [Myxococcales bacterium]
MARTATREVIASFDAYLRRTAALPEPIIRARIKGLQAGRLRAPDSSSPAFRRAPVVPGPVATGATMREETARGHGAASDDERAARMRERHPIVRAPVAFPEHAQHAAEVAADDARARLAAFRQCIAEQVEAGEVPWVDVPDLHRINSLHDDRGNVFLGQNVRRLALDRRSGKAFMRLLLAAEVASANLRDGVYSTKRGLYYQHQARLADGDAGQVESDRAIASLANLLGVRRRSLGFVEAKRGLMFGHLVLRDGEQVLDLAKLGPRGSRSRDSRTTSNSSTPTRTSFSWSRSTPSPLGLRRLAGGRPPAASSYVQRIPRAVDARVRGHAGRHARHPGLALRRRRSRRHSSRPDLRARGHLDGARDAMARLQQRVVGGALSVRDRALRRRRPDSARRRRA